VIKVSINGRTGKVMYSSFEKPGMINYRYELSDGKIMKRHEAEKLIKDFMHMQKTRDGRDQFVRFHIVAKIANTTLDADGVYRPERI